MPPTSRNPVRTATLVGLATGALFGLVAGLVAAVLPASAVPSVPPATAPHVEPTLVARATLSADFIAPGPPSGVLASPGNGRSGPFPGQVIPGFSAMIENGDGTFWAQPDNGFGTKANSADFLLRLYLVRPDWETADGDAGSIEVGRFISLRDPDHRVPFAITNEQTADRLLTGADFEIESVWSAPRMAASR